MKKNLLLIGIFIILNSLSAQSQKYPIEFGLKAGLNYSDLIIDKRYPMETNPKFGFDIGGFLSIELVGNLKLKPEISFSIQNTEMVYLNSIIFQDPNDPFLDQNFKADIQESLILVPIMLDYYFNQNFDLEIGPQFGFVINQKVSDNSDDLVLGIGEEDKFEIALNLGLGYNFADNYRIGLRYSYGITERDNINSSVFQLGLSYKL